MRRPRTLCNAQVSVPVKEHVSRQKTAMSLVKQRYRAQRAEPLLRSDTKCSWNDRACALYNGGRPRRGVQGAHLQPSPICGGGMNTQVSAPPEAALITATCCEKLVASAITCTTADTAR